MDETPLLKDRYRIDRRIGKGGMGAVYLATDTTFNSTVAIKETIVEGPEVRIAFEREAKILNQLRHASLPVVMDYFSVEDKQYLVMQYIPGDDLMALLAKNGLRPFPVETVIGWGYQLLAALEFLHGHEPPIIHRDIKPQNMKLTPRGEIVLLDFGLAKGLGTGKTQSGVGSIMGYTPNYAPFEQMEGSGTCPQSDIFALGATLYNLVTGTKPLDVMSRVGAVMYNKADPLPRADALNSDVPVAVADVLEKALAVAVEDRYQTAPEMADALRAAMSGVPASSSPSRIESVDDEAATMMQNTSSGDSKAGAASVVESTLTPGSYSASDAAADGGSTTESEPAVTATRGSTVAPMGSAAARSFAPRWLLMGAAALFLVFGGYWLWTHPQTTDKDAGNVVKALPATVSFPFTAAALDPSGHVTKSKATAECFVPDIGGDAVIQMVAIPAGKFLMGAPQTEAGRGNDEPQPQEEQVAAFYISRREITQKEWRLVATTLPQVAIPLPADPSTFKGDARPVENVSWLETEEFAARITKRTGRSFALPSRVQWEYSCRAGTASPFYFGETITPDVANYNAEVGYGKGPADGKPTETTDVGKFSSANQFGLDDMHGNVWEWCEDEYAPDESQRSSSGTTGTGLTRRALRGGSFTSLAVDCRSASRYALQETQRQPDVGFRLVMNPSTPK